MTYTGPASTNWHTANTASEVTIMHQMLNGDPGGELNRMAWPTQGFAIAPKRQARGSCLQC